MTDQTPVSERVAARVLLLDEQDRLLLFRCQEPGAERSFWITPGGGLEPGETHGQAALRELQEETGLVGVELGPCVWVRTHTFHWLGRTYRQHERFFLVRIDRHEVDPEGHTEEELKVLVEHRWWSVEEIASDQTAEFAPHRLGEWLGRLVEGPLPVEPVDVGV